ncbi:MAG: alpha/beta hydrolase-fold protein [Gammaproteobacteria bacterium]
MSATELTTVEIEPSRAARAAVIWMHGLGADGHDFEPIVPYLNVPPELGARFVFPNAPVRAVTLNGGARMRAWYDILGLDIPRQEDDGGIRASEQAIQALIRREQSRGIAAKSILLAGFSQGGAMALHTGLRYPERLAGVLALSCYVPLPATVESERHAVNQGMPIFIGHGNQDAIVPLAYGKAGLKLLQGLGYKPEWREYFMGHEVSMEEIHDIGEWLERALRAA